MRIGFFVIGILLAIIGLALFVGSAFEICHAPNLCEQTSFPESMMTLAVLIVGACLIGFGLLPSKQGNTHPKINTIEDSEKSVDT